MAARLAPSPGTASANALGLGETINARDFRPDAPGSFDLDFVGKITEDEARTACPYLPDVQSLLDKAARESGPIGNRSPQDYGTDVHVRLKREIDVWNNFRVSAERSYFKERAEAQGREPYYSERGTIRIDVREWSDDGTMCLYDIKTGREDLSLKRSVVIGHAAIISGIRRVLVIQLRPRR